MSRSKREEILRRRWLEVLRAELAHREEGEDSGARREQLIAGLQAQLEVIAERMCAVPGYIEPSDAEKTQWSRELKAWFRDYARRRACR
jgi:hypothetical protein